MKVIFAVLCAIVLFSCSPRPVISSSSSVVGPLASACNFSEDNGDSFKEAVMIGGVQTQRDGMAAEYHYISDRFGNRGSDWFLVGQTILSDQNRIIDVVEIQLKNPAERKLIYFDAGNFVR